MAKKAKAKVKTVIVSRETMTIDEALAALNYNPKADKWEAKDEDAQWAEIIKKKNEHEVKAAKATLYAFATSDADMPEDVKAAILRIANPPTKKSSGNGHANPFMENMRKLFPEVGTAVSEIDVFVATKMGRGEMKAKVRQNLKSAAPEARMWIMFNSKTDEWYLDSIGKAHPASWEGKRIDK